MHKPKKVHAWRYAQSWTMISENKYLTTNWPKESVQNILIFSERLQTHWTTKYQTSKLSLIYSRFHSCSCNNQRSLFRFNNMIVDELFHRVRYIDRCLWTEWTHRLRTFWTLKHLHYLLLICFNVRFTAVQSNFAVLSRFGRDDHDSSYEECDDYAKKEGVKSNPDFPVSSETHSWLLSGCDGL